MYKQPEIRVLTSENGRIFHIICMTRKIKLNYVEKPNVCRIENAVFFNGIWLALCREIIAVYSTKAMEYIDTLFGKTQRV